MISKRIHTKNVTECRVRGAHVWVRYVRIALSDRMQLLMSGQWTKKIVIDCYVLTKWAHSPTSPCALFLTFSTRGTYMYHQSLDLHSFFFYWQSATCHDWGPLCVPWRPPCVGTMCGTRPSSTPIYPILFFVDLSPNCVGRRSNLHSRCRKHAYTWLLDWLIRSTAASSPPPCSFRLPITCQN